MIAGREVLAALVEPKLLAGLEAEAQALHAHVDQLQEQRAELPPWHLSEAASNSKAGRTRRNRSPRCSHGRLKSCPVWTS